MKNFISIADHSKDEIQDLLDLALSLKKEWRSSGNPPLLKGKVLAMVFQKPSLRTRVSFDMAMRHLGGDALYLSPFEIGLGKRESIADISRVLSGYVEAVMARVFDHDHILQLAEWSSIPIINGLSDFNHPCQGMADGLTILEHYGQLSGLNLAFIGDGNNVSVSLLFLCATMGMNFTIASPPGYAISDKALTIGRKLAAESGISINIIQNAADAVEGADIIYTDTWTSMGQEEEAAAREQLFQPYQVNVALVKKARPSVIVMHCLPAHRGQEITDEVADGPHSLLFPQAHNRLHAQKAVLARVFGAA
jgi:ornithine carbamoyltransferase